MSGNFDREENTCPNCNGTGEGSHDGSSCTVCRGSGELPIVDNDWDYDIEADLDYEYEQV